jgi:hypothetical protein
VLAETLARVRGCRGLLLWESSVAARRWLFITGTETDAAGKDGHNYPPQARILQSLVDMPLPASIIIRSGRADGGLHVYWLLLCPFIVGTDEDRRRIKSLSERWQRLLKTKLAPYDLDSTFDLVRVLRPIGTTNHKYGTVVQALEFHPERRYSVEEIEAHLPPQEPPRPIAYTPASGADPDSVISRARAYIAKIPGAVSRAICGFSAIIVCFAATSALCSTRRVPARTCWTYSAAAAAR